MHFISLIILDAIDDDDVIVKFVGMLAGGWRERGDGFVVPMISAGVEGRLPHMTYPEPWRGQPKQPPEFLRPAPKPVPPIR